jgi:hypothetical protein
MNKIYNFKSSLSLPEIAQALNVLKPVESIGGDSDYVGTNYQVTLTNGTKIRIFDSATSILFKVSDTSLQPSVGETNIELSERVQKIRDHVGYDMEIDSKDIVILDSIVLKLCDYLNISDIREK